MRASTAMQPDLTAGDDAPAMPVLPSGGRRPAAAPGSEASASSSRQRVLRLAINGAVLVVAAATLASMAGRIELRRSLDLLRAAELGQVLALAPLLLLANLFLRAARLRALLPTQDGRPAPLREVLASVVLSMGANNVLPLRAGELVRTRDLVAHGLPVRQVLLAQMVEKVVELTTVLAWGAPALERLVIVGHPGVALVAAGGLFFGLLVGLLWIVGGWIVRAIRRGHLVPFVERGGKTAAVLQSLAWSLLGDATEVALIALCLRSLGIHTSFATAAIVFASVNLAVALPSTPGQVGVFEAGASLGLMMAGIPGPVAVAFALLYRVVLWLPVTALAGIVWLAGPRRTPNGPLHALEGAGRS